MSLKNIFLYPVEALNLVRSNVWSVALIVTGSVLVMYGHTDVGGSLVTGGFALLRSESAGTTTAPTPNPEPDPKAK